MVTEKKDSILKKYKYALVVGSATLVGIILAITLIGRPLYNSYKESKRVLTEKRAIVTKLEQKLVNLKALKDQEEEIKEKNQKVMAALPTNKDVARLFIEFESVAMQNGLIITSVQENKSGGTTPAEGASGVGPVAVSYGVSGASSSYSSVKSALASLEKALRILNISEIEINGREANNLDVDIKINTFVRSE